MFCREQIEISNEDYFEQAEKELIDEVNNQRIEIAEEKYESSKGKSGVSDDGKCKSAIFVRSLTVLLLRILNI